jgi:hypothetical protein
MIGASHALQGGERGLQLITRRSHLPPLGQTFAVDTLRFGVPPAGVQVIRRAQVERLPCDRTTDLNVMQRQFNPGFRYERAGQLLRIITSNTNLGSELNGASLGVNGLVLGYGGKLIIGLGSFGIIVGPYASINAVAGITRGSDLATGLVAYTCRSATLDLILQYGLGFAIPNWAQKAVNIFLGLFHAKPISTTYGTELGSVPIKSVSEAIPASCAAKPE